MENGTLEVIAPGGLFVMEETPQSAHDISSLVHRLVVQYLLGDEVVFVQEPVVQLAHVVGAHVQTQVDGGLLLHAIGVDEFYLQLQLPVGLQFHHLLGRLHVFSVVQGEGDVVGHRLLDMGLVKGLVGEVFVDDALVEERLQLLLGGEELLGFQVAEVLVGFLALQ